MRAPEIRPVRDSYRIDTASKTGIRSFIDRCNNAIAVVISAGGLVIGCHFVPSTTVGQV
jgi:hypothetical protein